jgi:hypothetical protein
VRTIVGVSTSTTVFVGASQDGPMDEPTLCLSYTEFAKTFSEDTSKSDLARYVKLFYLNGGTTCYVMRIADGKANSAITLNNEAKQPALKLIARNPGVRGDQIRATVTYDTEQPEGTFNIELFRWQPDPTGHQVKTASELWRNLSMNPTSANYAPSLLTQNSALITADVPAAPVAGQAYSQFGRPFDFALATFGATWDALAANKTFQLSVGGSPYVTVTMPAPATITSDTTLKSELKKAVVTALTPLPGQLATNIDVQLVDAPPLAFGDPDSPKWIQITHPTLDVFARPSLSNDCAVALMLGTAQGGLEVGAYAGARPAPTGMSLLPAGVFGNAVTTRFAALDPTAVLSMTIDGATIPFGAKGLQTAAAGNPAMYRDAYAVTPNDNNDGIREKLANIVRTVADYAATHPTDFKWKASAWGYRLNFFRVDDDADTDNAIANPVPAFVSWNVNANSRDNNVRYYALGATGTGDYQAGGVAGDDGDPPNPSTYDDAYPIIDREVDIFNLLVLPKADGVDPVQLYGAASVFCQQRRAFLLMDAPVWSDVSAAQGQVGNLRIGLVKDHAALYFPRLTVSENGLPVQVGPAGAIAGLMARIDSARGVWKAPAGTEADLRGVTGLERRFSDPENGVLNPKAINTLRVFPTGAVCWGARTMDGDDSNPGDYKYVPIRRLALFLEESLYRGLNWVVFEPRAHFRAPSRPTPTSCAAMRRPPLRMIATRESSTSGSASLRSSPPSSSCCSCSRWPARPLFERSRLHSRRRNQWPSSA